MSTEASYGAIAETTNELVHISELAVGPLRVQNLEVVRVAAEQPGARDGSGTFPGRGELALQDRELVA